MAKSGIKLIASISLLTTLIKALSNKVIVLGQAGSRLRISTHGLKSAIYDSIPHYCVNSLKNGTIHILYIYILYTSCIGRYQRHFNSYTKVTYHVDEYHFPIKAKIK